MLRKIAKTTLPIASSWRTSGREKTFSFIVRVRIQTLSSSGNRRVQFTVEDVSERNIKRFSSFDPATTWLAARIATTLSQPSGTKAGH